MAEFTPFLQEAKGILLLSCPEQQLCVKHSPGLAGHTGRGHLTLPTSTRLVTMTTLAEFSCQIILQKSFTVSCIGPGAGEKTKRTSQESAWNANNPSQLFSSHCPVPTESFSLSEHPSVVQGYSHEQPGALWEIRAFLTAGIWGSSRVAAEVMAPVGDKWWDKGVPHTEPILRLCCSPHLMQHTISQSNIDSLWRRQETCRN